MKSKTFFCKSDSKYHHISEIPKNLIEFINYRFSSNTSIGDDFKSFNTKFKNTIKKSLPENWEIDTWTRGHYYCSGMIKTNEGKYIYFSISDVRYSDEWIDNILIRTCQHNRDFTGGPNYYTNIITFGKDIQKLY